MKVMQTRSRKFYAASPCPTKDQMLEMGTSKRIQKHDNKLFQNRLLVLFNKNEICIQLIM